MHGTVSLRSVHGTFLSAQPDGRAEWNRNEAHDWEHFLVEQRHNGKISLKGVHGMYLSAQPDGSVQINRREAPEGGWEEFTVEDRGSDVVCLKSSHGKYLSAQQNGTAQWNRNHAPRGGWEDIQIEYQGSNSEIHDEEAIRLFKKTLDDHGVPSDFLAGIQTSRGQPTRGQPTRGQPARAEPSRIPPAPVQPSVETPSIDIASSSHAQGRYMFAPEEMFWNEHNDRAKARGMNLASISSVEENEQITRITGGKTAWIGGMRKGGGNGPGSEHWYWSDGRPWTYTNWAPGEPNNHGGGENRIQLYGNHGGKWNDVGEGWRGAAVYEMPVTAQWNRDHAPSPLRESIEILEAVPGKPVRFKINNPPSSNDAWVGIYHPSSSDQEIGKQKQQWEWLRDLDVNNASLPEQSEGNWSIRVFSDGGYKLHERKDFAVEPKREAFYHPTESSSPTYIGKPWHKLSKEEKESYPVSEGSLSLPSALSVVLGVPWFLFAFFVWQLPFLNTIWLGKCAYCPEAEFQNGEIWWGLLTPIANFGAVMPFLLGFLFLWWSIFPTPEWRRNEMAGWLFALPFAVFWLMLGWIAWDLHTWVEGSLGISDNYDMGSRELYWTFSWIAIPGVGSIALAPTYYSLKAILLGIHNSPPPPFQGELGSRILHEGNKGKDVSRLQELLNKMSNSNLTVDGHFGSLTKAALIEFETNNKLDPDGVLDPLALALLDKSNPNTNEELVELIDLIISVKDSKEKGQSRDKAELIFANLLETMPFNMRSSARQIWKEKFGINRDVLQWWK